VKRQLLAAAAVLVGLAMISPEAALAEVGAGQTQRLGKGVAGKFQTARLNKPKKKKRACRRRKKRKSHKQVTRAGVESFMGGWASS
jgi:hypothetical protein